MYLCVCVMRNSSVVACQNIDVNDIYKLKNKSTKQSKNTHEDIVSIKFSTLHIEIYIFIYIQ